MKKLSVATLLVALLCSGCAGMFAAGGILDCETRYGIICESCGRDGLVTETQLRTFQQISCHYCGRVQGMSDATARYVAWLQQRPKRGPSPLAMAMVQGMMQPQQRKTPNNPPPRFDYQGFQTPARSTVLIPSAIPLTVAKNNRNGFIALSDKSIWEVSRADRLKANLWLSTHSIKIAKSERFGNYRLVNVDTGESVETRLVGKR